MDPLELEDLREQIQRKQNTIDGLKSDNEEKEKDWKKKFEELEISMKELRNEKNTLNMVRVLYLRSKTHNFDQAFLWEKIVIQRLLHAGYIFRKASTTER